MILGDARKEAPKRCVTITRIVIFAALVLMIGWDLVVASNQWRGDTISELTLWTVLRSLTVPLLLGYICGHLTWPGKHRLQARMVLTVGGIVIGLTLSFDVLTWCKITTWDWLMFVRAWPPITFLPGYVFGHLFWPQVRQ